MNSNNAKQIVLGYLRTYPHAGDTLEGVARWWLASERINLSVVEIKKAIEQLEKDGLIAARDIGDGKRVYLATNIEE